MRVARFAAVAAVGLMGSSSSCVFGSTETYSYPAHAKAVRILSRCGISGYDDTIVNPMLLHQYDGKTIEPPRGDLLVELHLSDAQQTRLLAQLAPKEIPNPVPGDPWHVGWADNVAASHLFVLHTETQTTETDFYEEAARPRVFYVQCTGATIDR